MPKAGSTTSNKAPSTMNLGRMFKDAQRTQDEMDRLSKEMARRDPGEQLKALNLSNAKPTNNPTDRKLEDTVRTALSDAVRRDNMERQGTKFRSDLSQPPGEIFAIVPQYHGFT